ncbi:GNAT family N-acetyltransferase [uncultured Friedmanniella sp.]|uniref:GNAT family N-acetyltransferase n=1 Tax=uncultured Friedmanniella sp. TaxID=335381 RepID=UPI0035CBAD51
MPEQYDVRPATPDDAEDYVDCHVDCLAETYVEIMPPAFAELHRREAAALVDRTRQAWQAGTDQTSSWLARDATGEVVGVVRSGWGQQSWERELGAPTSSAPFQLHHLYTRQRTHGTGLGRQLLEIAVGAEHTYLWILHGNARADRFYRRQGFGPDGGEMTCGASWFHRTMYRLVRPAP